MKEREIIHKSDVVQVRYAATQRDIDGITAFFERVADEEGWQPNGALQAHRAQSVYFGLWSAPNTSQETLIGGMQLVQPTGEGTLPCHQVWPELNVVDKSTLHIAVLAVERDWRGISGGLFWPLAAEMWRYCVLAGIQELLLEATPRTLRCYQRMGWPLVVRGDLRPHWGEPCYLTGMSVREVGGSLTERAIRSPLYRGIVLRALCLGENETRK